MLIRIPSELKARLSALASAERRSLNQQIEYLLDKATSEKHDREERVSASRKPGAQKQRQGG